MLFPPLKKLAEFGQTKVTLPQYCVTNKNTTPIYNLVD